MLLQALATWWSCCVGPAPWPACCGPTSGTPPAAGVRPLRAVADRRAGLRADFSGTALYVVVGGVAGLVLRSRWLALAALALGAAHARRCWCWSPRRGLADVADRRGTAAPPTRGPGRGRRRHPLPGHLRLHGRVPFVAFPLGRLVGLAVVLISVGSEPERRDDDSSDERGGTTAPAPGARPRRRRVGSAPTQPVTGVRPPPAEPSAPATGSPDRHRLQGTTCPARSAPPGRSPESPRRAAPAVTARQPATALAVRGRGGARGPARRRRRASGSPLVGGGAWAALSFFHRRPARRGAARPTRSATSASTSTPAGRRRSRPSARSTSSRVRRRDRHRRRRRPARARSSSSASRARHCGTARLRRRHRALARRPRRCRRGRRWRRRRPQPVVVVQVKDADAAEDGLKAIARPAAARATRRPGTSSRATGP